MHLFDTPIVILLCYGLVTSTRLVSADGSVGCLFRKSLCEPKFEWCFDDYAFGRCVPRFSGEGEADFYQYQLNEGSLHLLRGELERLLNLGYRWSDYYTQCVFKALLSAFRYQREYDETLCDAYSSHRSRSALPYIQRNMEVDPENVGQVVFTPSVVDPHSEFADEIYFPGLKGRNTYDESMLLGRVRPKHENDRFDDLREAFLMTERNENKRSKDDHPIDITHPNDIEDDEPNYTSYLNDIVNEDPSQNYPYADYGDEPEKFHFAGSYNSPDHYQTRLESTNYDKDVEYLEKALANDEKFLKSFSKNYNTPDKFRNGHETKDEVLYPNTDDTSYQMTDDFFPEGRQFVYDNYNGFKNGYENLVKNVKDDGGVFTEGGLVHLKDVNKDETINSNSIEDIMKSFDGWGFKRPERLDVKKPGPSFSTNNFAFRVSKEEEEEKHNKGSSESGQQKSTEKQSSEVQTPTNTIAQPEKKKVGSPMESPSLRRHTTSTTMSSLKGKDLDDDYDVHDSEDDLHEYAYIKLKNRVNTWQEASRIVRKLEDLLRLNQNTFFNIRIDQNEVKFKVKPNRYHLSPAEVIKRIDANKNLIQRAIGQEVVSSGVGDQNKPPKSMSLIKEDERQLWILSFLLCGVIAAVAIAGAALFVFRRHSHNKEKLQNLSQMDSEASKDYQDLCRARMASKSSQEKPEGGIPGHRVTNLAKETEGSNHSPSSRSSTSSWSEEPALTNMDISTGHMVLSYMEDHLKNKDRLEQEWIALCAYEAEPCATNIAMKEENMKKNRYNDVLPYDHARVVLNELSNISGSDYINASTITDHDPRNPAYIASQGPLPNTSADFWQMIWEQGSVVMVMLTRLTENGTALCHRYWPEEGSELYHIYEVHLVSEHIWCDDYLVRSFYLKNLKTGETRTVTQFHFLSWPENGIPLSTKALLEFRRKVNKSYRGRSCPIIVHCSDGVGRTGTYCLIDMVLNRMSKGAKEIDIAATLEHIRDQRPLMVRTKQQFEFVLMAVAEEVHAILKALPANPNHSPPPVLKEKD